MTKNKREQNHFASSRIAELEKMIKVTENELIRLKEEDIWLKKVIEDIKNVVNKENEGANNGYNPH